MELLSRVKQDTGVDAVQQRHKATSPGPQAPKHKLCN